MALDVNPKEEPQPFDVRASGAQCQERDNDSSVLFFQVSETIWAQHCRMN
jgi:hypothetical protein